MIKNKYCIANWKMTLTPSAGKKFTNNLKNKDLEKSHIKIILCPPFTGLFCVKQALLNTDIELGAQNIFFEDYGAYTGEISNSMLSDLECKWVILGHSERRHVFGENLEVINKKLRTVLSNDLSPILCVGETSEERENGDTGKVIKEQIRSAFQDMKLYEKAEILIAYEPVWAIGTGNNATPSMIEDAHVLVRSCLDNVGLNGKKIPVLYGGSVKPENADVLIDVNGVDGFLIGGASVKVESFYEIYRKM